MIDVFKVGVHIGMTTNSTQVLGVMLSQLTGVHVAARDLTTGLNNVGKAALGVGAVFAGWKVLDIIADVIKGNRDLNKELEKTKQLGGDFAKNLPQTRDNAVKTQMEVPTSTLSNNVKLQRELGQTLGHPDAAGAILTEAAKVAFLAHNYTGESEEDIIKNISRAADSRGQIYSIGPDGQEHVDPVKLQAEMNAAYKSLIMGGGFVKSGDLFQMTKQAGPEAKGQTPEAFYAAGAEAGIAMGASKLGTSEMSLFQQFMGGTMTRKTAMHLEEAGLLKHGEWKPAGGQGVSINPSVSKRFAQLEKDPVEWLETGEGGTAVRNYADKFGISITTAIAQLFGRQTTQRLVNEAMSNEPQFKRAREIWGNVPDVQAAYKEQMDNNLDANLAAVSAAWKSFLEAFSDANTGPLITILHGLTDAIQFLEKATADHPLIVEGLTGLVAGIAGLTALGGSILVFNVCWAPLIGGIGALAGVTGLASVGTALGGVATGLGAIAAVVSGPLAVALAAFYALKPNSLKEGGPGSAEDTEGYKHRFDSAPPKSAMPDGTATISPYVAPAPSGDGTGKRAGDVYLDGKKVGMIIDNYQANSLSRPPTGSPGADYRVSPVMPGQATAFG